MGGIHLQTLLPPPAGGRRIQSFVLCCLPSLRPPEPLTSSRAFDRLQSFLPDLHTYTTSIPARLPDLYASSTRAISTNTIKWEERRSPGTAMAGRLVGKSYITGRKRRSM
jgi:hypothetical protein